MYFVIVLIMLLAAPLVLATPSWPDSVQPFWLSSLGANLTAENATYLGSLPVVIINHKQGGGAPGYY